MRVSGRALARRGSDEIFAGYPHFRRDLVLHGSHGRDPGEQARLLAELEAANRASAGMLLPQGSTTMESVQRVLGFVPSSLESWAQIGTGLLRMTCDGFRHAYGARDTFRIMLTCLDSVLDGPGIYDRRKVTSLLDSIASMDAPGRARADALRMWMTSLCLLSERMGI